MTLYALDGVSPLVDDTAWLAPGTHVMGNVELAAHVGIWFGAVLRGDNEPIRIGEGSNVQENVVCHTDMGFPLEVGAGCTVGHKAILHGCTVGDGSLIGMGASVLNGAVIGQRCLVGAGALVTEGKVFPDGTLIVGAPAKVRRELTEDELAGLIASAKGYQANARRFRDGLSKL